MSGIQELIMTIGSQFFSQRQKKILEDILIRVMNIKRAKWQTERAMKEK